MQLIEYNLCFLSFNQEKRVKFEIQTWQGMVIVILYCDSDIIM